MILDFLNIIFLILFIGFEEDLWKEIYPMVIIVDDTHIII